MKLKSTDRTSELEIRLKAIQVSSEDTCCFWSKKKDTQMLVKRCFHCEHFRAQGDNENRGFCTKGVGL